MLKIVNGGGKIYYLYICIDYESRYCEKLLIPNKKLWKRKNFK